MARDTRRGGKKKVSKNIAAGVAHVNSSFNNTKILISDVQGNAIAWSSSGTMGFKGSRKSTPYAAQMAAEDVGRKAQEHGVKTLEVEVQGTGVGARISAAGAGCCWFQHHFDSRCDADGPQWLSPTKASSSVSNIISTGGADLFALPFCYFNLGRLALLDMGARQGWRIS